MLNYKLNICLYVIGCFDEMWVLKFIKDKLVLGIKRVFQNILTHLWWEFQRLIQGIALFNYLECWNGSVTVPSDVEIFIARFLFVNLDRFWVTIHNFKLSNSNFVLFRDSKKVTVLIVKTCGMKGKALKRFLWVIAEYRFLLRCWLRYTVIVIFLIFN